MVKHKRWSDNFKKLPPKDTDLENTKEIIDETTTTDLKSILRSGTKYAYILVAAALLSGIFTPLTLGVESEKVIFGMLIIFLGMFGGVVILLGIKKQKSTFHDSTVIRRPSEALYFRARQKIHGLTNRFEQSLTRLRGLLRLPRRRQRLPSRILKLPSQLVPLTFESR